MYPVESAAAQNFRSSSSVLKSGSFFFVFGIERRFFPTPTQPQVYNQHILILKLTGMSLMVVLAKLAAQIKTGREEK